MWNSPHSQSESGKRYRLADLSALVIPLDEMLYLSESTPVSDLVEEKILRSLDRGELVFALYEVFEALTSDVAIPDGGHPGIHEAIIAELLHQAFDQVVCEVEMRDGGDLARKAVWNSVDRLLVQRNPDEPSLPWILEDAGLTLSDLRPFRPEKLTLEHWEELLVGENLLFAEFLCDDDWRMDSLMDLDPDTAKMVTDLVGLNLEVVHALPHTPNEAELRMAERYLREVIAQLEEEDRSSYLERGDGLDDPFG